MIKRRAIILASVMVLGLIAAAGGAVLVAWSGVITVSAAAGHSAPVAWFLHFAMRHSVKTHSIAISTPDLSDAAKMYVGLGHYESACAPCHGSPDRRASTMTARELPPPPYLPDEIKEWKPQQLFWIVKNGVKYTGMPGWPAQNRDDEVWEMVAALLRLPGVSADEYARLLRSTASPSPDVLPETARDIAATGGIGPKLAACGRCHGMDGAGGGGLPRLAGQQAAYLHDSLAAYRAGTRPSGIMGPVATELSDRDIDLLTQYFAAQTSPVAPRVDFTTGPGADGARLAKEGIPAHGIPACNLCHDTGKPYPNYPNLRGLSRYYIAQQLILWRSGNHGGTRFANVMTAVAQPLTDADIAALASYYGGDETQSMAAK